MTQTLAWIALLALAALVVIPAIVYLCAKYQVIGKYKGRLWVKSQRHKKEVERNGNSS